MNPDQYRAVRRLFHEAMGLEEGERAAFVRAAAPDETVKTEALALLDAESRAGDGDADPIERALGVPGLPGMPEEVAGFRVLREIGAGAVGTVYEAEQASPKRRVALKLLRRAGASERVAQRFEAESEVLGRLVHPGVARVYASGVAPTPAGPRRYIAMEYVDGAPITSWARDAGLTADQRTELLARVCDAVHHAHQRGVIHRDLKPANILVTADGDPKVLDFGIARATDEDLASPVDTMQGEVLGTLDYMSPEQARAGEGVDVRADVYALGGVLFELVAGERALDTGAMTLATALDAVRAEERRRLRDAVPGVDRDLDLIVATALRPDREERYPSAEAMASDLRRLLRHEPIVARPPTVAYRAAKFVRRNRVGVGVGALVAVALLGATAVSINAAAAAQRERADAERTLALLTDAIASADPSGGNPADYTLREFLTDFAGTLDGADPAPSPGAEAQLRGALGESFIGLGLPDAALPELEVAATLRERTLGADHPSTLEARVMASVALLDAGRTDEGLERLHALSERCTGALGPAHETTRSAVFFLASAKFKANDPAGALPLFEDLLDANTQTYGEEHDETVSTMSSLALVLQRLGRLEEALVYNERAAELDVIISGPDNPGVLVTRGNLGGLYVRLGRLDDAERVLTDVLERRRRVLPAEHRHIGASLSSLEWLYTARADYEVAERHGLAAFEHFDTHQGPDHPYTDIARSRLARLYEAWGKAEEAERWRE